MPLESDRIEMHFRAQTRTRIRKERRRMLTLSVDRATTDGHLLKIGGKPGGYWAKTMPSISRSAHRAHVFKSISFAATKP